MERGKFIVLEGINGAGKSTQAVKLAERLKADGFEVVQIFDPGSSEVGMKIREIVKYDYLKESEKLHVNTQIALYAAARTQTAYSVIWPAIEAGKIVIADRWYHSTLAYQGYAQDAEILGGSEGIISVMAILTGGLKPDHTVVLDVDIAEAQNRRKVMEGDKADRFESQGDAFQKLLHQAYVLIASTQENTVLIDANSNDIDVVHTKVYHSVTNAIHATSIH